MLTRNGLTFTPLTDVEWRVYPFKSPPAEAEPHLSVRHSDPFDLSRPAVLHLPTVKTMAMRSMTGSVKNSFGGLLKEARHYAHKYMHE